MALHDNPHWLLSYTRESFISSDDTGMCEVVMVSENIARQLPVGKYYTWPGAEDEDEDDDNASQSYEIHSSLHFGLHRHRSNTAQRLERLEEEKKRAASIAHFKWITNPVPLTGEEKAELFARKDLAKVRDKEKNTKRVSLLTELLAKTPLMPKNPFHEYAKFDGNAQVGVPTKKYGIFLTMLRENGNYPMRVVIIATAKISDLIGLICWKCSNEYSEIVLKDSVNDYGLYIAEDDGEVDRVFPSLDSKESVAKFGFSYLALVERDPTLNHEDSCISLEENLLKPLGDSMCGKTKEQIQMEDEMLKFQGQMTAIEAPLYQSYTVFILNKVLSKTEVYLGVSGDKIEIDPVAVPRAGHKFWGRQRALVHHIDSIFACEIVELKSNNKSVFRIVYEHKRDNDTVNYKNHLFECDSRVASEIVMKVNHIIEVKQSHRRSEYLELRERKSNRRKTFRLVPR